jgi:5'-methylthioinosine phosphorylase
MPDLMRATTPEPQSLLAIIGGNSLSSLPGFDIAYRRVERTPYGDPSSPLLFGKLHQRDIVFLARHGVGFTLSPDEVNDLANIQALKQAGAQAIIGISSAVALAEAILPGDFVIPDQLIDMCNQRMARFPRAPDAPYRPLPFAEPFDTTWQHKMKKAAPSDQAVHWGGTYLLTSGLRSETLAEANFYRTIGGATLGATGAQEAALARDLDIPFVLILVIVRHAIHAPLTAPAFNLNTVAQRLATWLGAL